jgi:hypothetical protein
MLVHVTNVVAHGLRVLLHLWNEDVVAKKMFGGGHQAAPLGKAKGAALLQAVNSEVGAVNFLRGDPVVLVQPSLLDSLDSLLVAIIDFSVAFKAGGGIDGGAYLQQPPDPPQHILAMEESIKRLCIRSAV